MPVNEPSDTLAPPTREDPPIRKDSIHSALRHATADPHERLDRGLAFVLSEHLSLDRYVSLLAALYGFYAPLEIELARWTTGLQPGSLPLVRRAPLLEHDLDILAASRDDSPHCRRLPRLTSVHHAAGALYVVEGACLGGQVIARAVRRHVGLGPETGAAFFTGDGAETGRRWKQVVAWIGGLDQAPGAREVMVSVARETFADLTQWLSEWELLDG